MQPAVGTLHIGGEHLPVANRGILRDANIVLVPSMQSSVCRTVASDPSLRSGRIVDPGSKPIQPCRGLFLTLVAGLFIAAHLQAAIEKDQIGWRGGASRSPRLVRGYIG